MTISKRIEKIEALIKAPPGALLLSEPPPDAPEAAFDDQATKVANALLQEAAVIVIRNGSGRLRRPGVIYVDDDFNGLSVLLANSAATDGRSRNKLSQIIAEVQGSSLPVVREVRNGTL